MDIKNKLFNEIPYFYIIIKYDNTVFLIPIILELDSFLFLTHDPLLAILACSDNNLSIYIFTTDFRYSSCVLLDFFLMRMLINYKFKKIIKVKQVYIYLLIKREVKYVGSSKNLSRRLRDYFNLNYLQHVKSMYISWAL